MYYYQLQWKTVFQSFKRSGRLVVWLNVPAIQLKAVASSLSLDRRDLDAILFKILVCWLAPAPRELYTVQLSSHSCC